MPRPRSIVLNCRLAAHIKRVRQLETENSRLARIVQMHGVVTGEVTGVKDLYEAKLVSVRQRLDETAKDKTQLNLEVGHLRKELGDLRDKLTVKEKDLSSAENSLMLTKSQVHDLQVRLNNAMDQHKHWEERYKKLEKEFDLLTENLATSRKELDDETILRVELANKVMTLRDKFALDSQVHEQLVEDYEDKLRGAVQMMGEEFDEKNCIMKENLKYEAHIQELENQLKKEQDSYRAKVDVLTAQIRILSTSLKDRLKENMDLMNVKVQLEMEMVMCRKLLDSEDSRLNITSEGPIPGHAPCFSAGGNSSHKRHRHTEDSAYGMTPAGMSLTKQAASSAGYETTTSAKDVIKVSLVDPGAIIVKVYNSSAEKEVALGGWQLKQFCGDNETTYVYKFHCTLRLKPRQYVTTIWSSDADQQHSLPVNLVTKEQAFFPADSMKIVLLDHKGEEMASLEKKRATATTSFVPLAVVDEQAARC